MVPGAAAQIRLPGSRADGATINSETAAVCGKFPPNGVAADPVYAALLPLLSH